MEKQHKTAPATTDLDFDDIDENEGVIVAEGVNDDDVSPAIAAMLLRFKEQNTNYVDIQLGKVVQMVQAQTVVLEQHDTRMSDMEQLLEQHTLILKSMSSTSMGAVDTVVDESTDNKQQTGNPVTGVVCGVLGTVGGVLHTVVDTAAFLLESTVDLVTFGKARRTPHN